MRKRIGVILIISMLLISMSGTVVSVLAKSNFEEVNIISSVFTADMKSSVDSLNKTVNKYLNMDTNNYELYNQVEKNIDIPWMTSNNDSLLEWWVRLEYNGQTFDKQVDISIDDFSEKFLKHPEYGEILNFNIDSDSENDVEVIVGFYWSVIRYPGGTDARSLESRFRVRQMPNGGIQDEDGEFEVWSDLRVNYGLINAPGKSKSLSHSLSDSREFSNYNYQPEFFLNWFIEKLDNQMGNERFTLLENIFKKKMSTFDEENIWNVLHNRDVAPLISDGNEDYISIGSGYRSPEGQKIPLLVEKSFSFAKSLSWSWQSGSIFNPTVFQHKMDPGGTDPIELLYGFQASDGDSDAIQYDIAFSVEFDPAVYLITKFIPTESGSLLGSVLG